MPGVNDGWDSATPPGNESASTQTTAAWNPLRLSAEHMWVIRQHVLGVPMRRIARDLARHGLPFGYRHIKKIVASEAGREFASLVSAQVHGGIQGLVEAGAAYLPNAISIQLGVMHNPMVGARHQLAAAQDHMSRFGLPLASRQENESKTPQTIIVNLTPEQYRQFTEPKPVIEATVVELPPEQSSADDEPVVGTIARLSRGY